MGRVAFVEFDTSFMSAAEECIDGGEDGRIDDWLLLVEKEGSSVKRDSSAIRDMCVCVNNQEKECI